MVKILPTVLTNKSIKSFLKIASRKVENEHVIQIMIMADHSDPVAIYHPSLGHNLRQQLKICIVCKSLCLYADVTIIQRQLVS